MEYTKLERMVIVNAMNDYEKKSNESEVKEACKTARSKILRSFSNLSDEDYAKKLEEVRERYPE